MVKKLKNDQSPVLAGRKSLSKKDIFIAWFKKKLFLSVLSYIFKELCPFLDIVELVELLKNLFD